MIIIIYKQQHQKKNNTSQNQNQKKKNPTKPNRKLKAITNHIFLKTFFFERFNVDGCVCVSVCICT